MASAVEALREEHTQQLEQLALPIEFSGKVDEDLLKAWQKEPYCLIHFALRPNTYYLVVPRFVPLHLGWLEWRTLSHNVFIITSYTRLMFPLPRPIQDRLGPAPSTDFQVEDGLLKTPVDMQDQA